MQAQRVSRPSLTHAAQSKAATTHQYFMRARFDMPPHRSGSEGTQLGSWRQSSSFASSRHSSGSPCGHSGVRKDGSGTALTLPYGEHASKLTCSPVTAQRRGSRGTPSTTRAHVAPRAQRPSVVDRLHPLSRPPGLLPDPGAGRTLEGGVPPGSSRGSLPCGHGGQNGQ